MTQTATANYFITALKSQRHTVHVCSDINSIQVNTIVYGAFDVEKLLSRIKFRPDMLLFIEGGSMQLLPVGLEKLTFLTAWYGIDTHMDYQKHLRIGRLFDVSFIAQQEYVSRLMTDGLRQVYWLPLAYAPELTPNVMPDRDIDISFVGSTDQRVHPERQRMLEILGQEYSNHYFGQASPSNMMNYYSRSRLVFNKSVNNDINMRFFEASGVGAVLVTNPIVNNGLSELFTPGLHYIEYKDIDSLIMLVKQLLENPSELAAIGNSARNLVLEKHTYMHRTQELISKVGCSKKIASAIPADYFAATISLGLMGGALESVANGLKGGKGGIFQQAIGIFLSVFLRCLSKLIRMLEVVRMHIRSRQA